MDQDTETRMIQVDRRERRMYHFELLLILILGFLLGIVVKTEAAKRITIGFNDYQVASKSQSYDFNQLEKNLAQQQQDQGNSGSAAATPGGSCQQ